jgi:hypothetical protein
MTKGLISQNKYEYRIDLINKAHPELSVKREYCSTFEIGECWGYNQFEPLDQLATKGFLKDDTLTFRVGIRNSSYRALVIEKELYIASLRHQLEQKSKKPS